MSLYSKVVKICMVYVIVFVVVLVLMVVVMYIMSGVELSCTAAKP